MLTALIVLAALAAGYLLGNATAIRRCAALLRDTCHYEAANLIDPDSGDAR